jgi:hypothetical protein
MGVLSVAFAQDAPPPPQPAVKLRFLPPPMEGTISMGIFDSTGKLVRTLNREAAIESTAFFKEINGLVTWWDGKDDAGNLMPSGKYSARGYMVGDLQVEGEAFHCNDWATDENSTPRIRKITALGPFTDTVSLGVVLADGSSAQAQCAASGSLTLNSGSSGNFTNATTGAPIASGTRIASTEGREGSSWVIDRAPAGAVEVKQISSKGEFLRRMAIDPSQPIPMQIAASKTTDAICLLEENAQCQRLRWLELSKAPDSAAVAQSGTETSTSGTDTAQKTGTSAALTGTEGGGGVVPQQATVSTWREVLRRDITPCDRLEQVQAQLKMPNGKQVAAQTRLRIQLVPNPLLQDKASSMEIILGIDADGSFIQTADGLFLKRITDTPSLKWAVLDRDAASDTAVIFQSDGAVVEEFRAKKIGNIMAFDYGEFQFPPAKRGGVSKP